jgi:hypothetical protein
MAATRRWLPTTCTAAYVVALSLAGLFDLGLMSGLALYAVVELRPFGRVRARRRGPADEAPAESSG